MPTIRLNHVALQVRDIERSMAFYHYDLGLPLLPRPNFKFKGAWIGLGEGHSLHLIEGLDKPVHQAPRGSHFALGVDKLEPFVQMAEEKDLNVVKGPKQRPDGVWQLFIADPDGYVIEWNSVNY